ncbi:MAG: PEP-CTERM sorting domain-containing protein [Opitutaceae bacterium]|jgi:hypothetical protein|nr:PEP-CTERM sorting domain-containing protein [Opitutaceae bacterium]
MNPRKIKKTTLTALAACVLACVFPASPLSAQTTLYWTATSVQWVTAPDLSTTSAQWSATAGGPMDQRWTNDFSAVINVPDVQDAQILLAPNDRLISVDTLVIQGAATLLGSAGNTRILAITGGGSGTLTLATTSTSTAANGSYLRFNGTSAWAGTIATGASAGAADKNRVQIQQTTAVGTTTKLLIDGARIEVLGNSGDAFTIGELKGSGGALRLATHAAGSTKTLIVDQATDTTFAGVIEESVAAGTSVLTKQGNGSLTLDGANTIDQVNVNDGSLIVNGSISGAVSVTQGATLGGTGSVGAVTLNNGAVIRFLLDAPQNLAASSLVKGTDGGGGGVYVFDFGGTGVAGETRTLSSVVGAGFNASDFSAINLAEGVTGVFTLSGSELKFVTTAIPEPSTWALLTGGVSITGALIMRQRRRRRH